MASNTTELNLYKVDPVADASMYFNIDTILNNNWDKVDAGVKADRLKFETSINDINYSAINLCSDPNGILNRDGWDINGNWSRLGFNGYDSIGGFVHNGGNTQSEIMYSKKAFMGKNIDVYFSCAAYTNNLNALDVGINFYDENDTFLKEEFININMKANIDPTKEVYENFSFKTKSHANTHYIKIFIRIPPNTPSGVYAVTAINVTMNKKSPLNHGGAINWLRHLIISPEQNIINIIPNSQIASGNIEFIKSYAGVVYVKFQAQLTTDYNGYGIVVGYLPKGYRPTSLIYTTGLLLTSSGMSHGKISFQIGSGDGKISIYGAGAGLTPTTNGRQIYGHMCYVTLDK